MKRTVLFTGAGVSKEFGYPLTGELLPQLREELTSGVLFRDLFGNRKREAAQRRLLDRRLRALLPGFAEAPEESLPPITDVLSLIDYSLLAGSTPVAGRQLGELAHLRRLLEAAIFDVMVELEPRGSQVTLLNRLARWIWEQNTKKARQITLISTNYDTTIEQKLFNKARADGRIGREFDFGFPWRHPLDDVIHARPPEPRFRIYKVHGALNWLKCALCGYITINTDEDILYLAYRQAVDDWNTCWCDHAPLDGVLVAPSLVRDVREPNLMAVWSAAQEALRVADEWILAGYSLPSEDIAIRSMLMRAWQSREEPPDVVVIQREPGNEATGDDATRDRYRLLFPDCRYRNEGMGAFIKGLP